MNEAKGDAMPPNGDVTKCVVCGHAAGLRICSVCMEWVCPDCTATPRYPREGVTCLHCRWTMDSDEDQPEEPPYEDERDDWGATDEWWEDWFADPAFEDPQQYAMDLRTWQKIKASKEQEEASP
jgi:hypothetical protein